MIFEFPSPIFVSGSSNKKNFPEINMKTIHVNDGYFRLFSNLPAHSSMTKIQLCWTWPKACSDPRDSETCLNNSTSIFTVTINEIKNRICDNNSFVSWFENFVENDSTCNIQFIFTHLHNNKSHFIDFVSIAIHCHTRNCEPKSICKSRGQRVSLFARLTKARGVSIEACAYQILLPRRNSANSVAFHAKRIPTARTRTRACIATGVKSSSAVEHGVSSPAFVYATSCRWLKGLESKKKIRWRICHESRSLAVRGKTRWWQDEGTEGVRLVRWIQKLVLWELLVFLSLSFSLSLFLYFFLFTV